MASLDDVFLRIDGAESHLQAVEREREAFLERDPYGIVGQFKPQQFKHLFRAVIREQPPASLRRAVGAVLQDLRNGLDNLAYQLAVIKTGQDPPPDENGIAFPIFLKSKAFGKGSQRPLKNIGATARTEIVALQPFNRAKELDPLWILHRLAQDDKHKKPVVVGSAVSGSSIHFDYLRSIGAFQDKTYYGPFTHNAVVAEILLNPGPTPDYKFDFHLTADIAFPKEGPAQGRPIVEVLPELLNFVRVEVVPRFQQFF